MKNKFVYFLAGAFLFGLVIFVFQISQASPAIPNPGHGTSQIAGDADLNMNDYKITNLKDPTSDQDAATKAYANTCGLTPGMIAMFDTACPSGWTRFSALDSKFPRGASSYGATGGSATHTHTVVMLNHPSQSSENNQGGYPARNGTRTSDASSSLPPYLQVVWCKKD